VNEEGTEAAAVTHISLIGGGDPSELPRFKADHPFAFILAYRKSHILFNGIFDG
jgi:serine protease inhibitor